MDYYHCPAEELRQEIQRRGYIPCGGQDALSEGLTKDDDARGTHATTVATVVKDCMPPKSGIKTAQYGQTVHPSLLVGEKITHWTMNTFFPTLQLFFDSGLSCTVEGGQLRNASIGLDRNLQFRLTDVTHEENGVLVKSTLSEKFSPTTAIRILEAVVAERISIAVKPVFRKSEGGMHGTASMGREVHMVLGLRLEGMTEMGYVWAKADRASENSAGRFWGDVRVAGLRDDVPAPLFGFPRGASSMGSRTVVVNKGSMISSREQSGMFGER